jgi:hypothetical protein
MEWRHHERLEHPVLALGFGRQSMYSNGYISERQPRLAKSDSALSRHRTVLLRFPKRCVSAVLA